NRLAHVDSRTIVTHFAMVATVTCTAVFLFSGGRELVGDVKSTRSVSMLLGMGLLGTMGQIALTRAFALGEPSMVSVVGLSEMVFSAVYDRLFWHRAFGAMTIAGMFKDAATT